MQNLRLPRIKWGLSLHIVLLFALVSSGAWLLLSLKETSQAYLTNGKNAYDAIGMFGEDLTNPTPDYTKGYFTGNDAANRRGLDDPRAMALDTVNHRFFLADENNGRVLIYNLNNDNTFPDRLPDFVLGKQNFTSRVASSPSATILSFPYGLAFDSANNRLFVADRGHHRVLVYDTATITNGEAAVNVLGQASFTTQTSATTQSGLNTPQGLAYDAANQRLFVSQTGAHRVSVFDVSTITDGEAAINVLGQPDFTTGTAATTQAGMSRPMGMAYDATGGRLFVAEENNNRLTVWDVNTITDGENAVNVLGKADFTTVSGPSSQSVMLGVRSVAFDSATNKLYVGQGSNGQRVLVFDIATLTDGEPAINVIGKSNFTTTTGTVSQSNLTPSDLLFDPTLDRLYVSEGYDRVTVFDVSTITDGENAIDALGQSDNSDTTNPTPVYTRSGANDGPNQFGLFNPEDVLLDTVNHRLYVADNGNRRVAVYNLNVDNTLPDRIIDNVLGQADLISGASLTASQSTVNQPKGLAFDAARNWLFVSDLFSNRVLVYDVTTITNNQNAIYVLGQPDFTTTTLGVTQSGMGYPAGLAYDSVKQLLYVANSHTSANRVTVYDVASITNGENAVAVLGQPDFVTGTAALTQSGMAAPQDVEIDTAGQRLFVVSKSQHRVLVYDVATITNGENAINVLGQANFTSSAIATTQSSVREARGVTFDPNNNRLFVSGNNFANRITVFDTTTITDNENAISLLGKTSYTDAAGQAITSQSTLYWPASMDYNPTSRTLYVADYFHGRIMLFEAGPIPGITKTESGGTTAVTEGGATDSFDVVLNTQPLSDVVLNISSNDTSAATVNTSTLTFTTGNWNTPQTVTVTAPEDSDVVSENVTVTIAVDDPSSDDDYDTVANVLVNVSVTDNDSAGFSITESSGSTAVTEGGATDSFDVVLTAQPSSNVVLSVTSNDTTAATVNFSTLTFTTATWNTPQTVTVTAPQDADTVSENPTITISVVDASSDNAWDPLADQTVSVAVTDNDTPGYTLSETGGSTNVTEGGATDTVSVVLTAQPSTDVVIDVSSNDTTAATLSTSALTFTTANWNVAQNVTISAPEDVDLVNETPTFTASIHDATSDNAWDPLADQTVTIHVTDNDTPNITVTESGGSTAVTEGGATDSFTVALTAQPASDVVLNVTSNDTSSMTVSPATLTFTSANWNTTQTVTVTAPEDVDIVSETPSVVLEVNDASSDDAWDPLANVNIAVTVTDNDTAGFTVTESGGSTDVTEGGATDSFDVILTAQPSSDVVFAVSSSNIAHVTVSTSSLTFTTANWSTAQTVTVTAPEDANVVSESPTITISVNDPLSDDAWDPLASTVLTVQVTDNDVAGLTVTASGGSSTANEGGLGDTLEVLLSAQPSSDVVLSVVSSDPALLSVSPVSLTFTSINWNTPQTIFLTAVDDPDALGGTATVTISVVDASSDDAFDGLSNATSTVTVIDDEVVTPAVVNRLYTGGGGGFSAPSQEETAPTESSEDLRSAAPEAILCDTEVCPEDEETTGSGALLPGQGGNRGSGGGGGLPITIPTIPDTRDMVDVINTSCTKSQNTGLVISEIAAANQQKYIPRGELIRILLGCSGASIKENYDAVFTDVPLSYKYAPYIYEALALGIVDGYPDGSFQPENSITREEATKIIVLTKFDGYAESTPEGQTPFKDVVSGEWYAKYISFGFYRGYLTGYLLPDGTRTDIFGVGDFMTRKDVLRLIVRIFNL